MIRDLFFYVVFFMFLVLIFEAGRIVGFTEAVELSEALLND